MKLNKECPICLYNDDNEEYGKKVWNIQLQLHPSFNKIKYKHLYTWSFAQPSSGNNGDFDFGGDSGGGGDGGGSGGATGSW